MADSSSGVKRAAGAFTRCSMFAIVAHMENYAIVTEGATERQGRDQHAGYDQTTMQPTVCTCGGVNIRVRGEDGTRRGRSEVFTDNGHFYA